MVILVVANNRERQSAFCFFTFRIIVAQKSYTQKHEEGNQEYGVLVIFHVAKVRKGNAKMISEIIRENRGLGLTFS
jgi:hypothetical protein